MLNVLLTFISIMIVIFHCQTFLRLINDLSCIAQGKHALRVGITPQQEKAMKVKGLKCLVSILKSLEKWSHDLHTDPSTMGLNTVTSVGQQSSLLGEPVPMDQNEIDAVQTDVSTNVKGTLTNLRKSHLRGISIALSHLATSAADDPKQFEKQHQRKEIMECGITL